MKIKVFNEESIQQFKTDEPHIIISVRSPSTKKIELLTNPTRRATLFLTFHDIEDGLVSNMQEWAKERQLTTFSNIHARLILSFIKTWKGKINLICINCEAGISRSAGIAGALSYILNADDTYYFKNYLPNRLVYRTILNEYYGVNYDRS